MADEYEDRLETSQSREIWRALSEKRESISPVAAWKCWWHVQHSAYGAVESVSRNTLHHGEMKQWQAVRTLGDGGDLVIRLMLFDWITETTSIEVEAWQINVDCREEAEYALTLCMSAEDARGMAQRLWP